MSKETRDIIRLEGKNSYGPKMRALPTDGMRRFVVAMLEIGDNDRTRAAAAAGYQGDANCMRVTAHRLAHDDRVLAAIDEEARKRLNGGKIMAVSTLLTIAKGASKDADRLKAIDMILNRTGMPAMTETTHKVIDESRTDETLAARAQFLAAKFDIPVERLLGYKPKGDAPAAESDVVDAEFSEVEPPAGDDISDLL